jgi:hypothetical protein
MTLRNNSVVRCRSNHATTIGSRSRLLNSDSVTVSIRNIRAQDRASAPAAREFAVILRHGEQQIGKGRRPRAFEAPQAFVLYHVHHDDGGLAVLGDSLRRAPRCLDDLAEPILCILHRPTALDHPRSSF